MKIILSLLLALSSLVARPLDEVIDDKTLVVGLYRDFPPYSFVENEQPKGIDVEIAQEVAKALGVAPSWHWMGSDETLEDDLRSAIWRGHLINRKMADMMMRVPYDYDFIRQQESTGELSNELVFMKAPYHSEGWAVGVNKQTISTFKDLSVFKNYKLAIELDTLLDKYLMDADLAYRKNVIHFKYLQNAKEYIEQNKVDALGGMRSQIQYYLHDKSKYLVKPFDIGKKPIWNIGIAVRSDSRDLGYEIEYIISELIKKGTIKKIFAHYHISWNPPIIE